MPPYPLTNFEIQRYYLNDAQLSSKYKAKTKGVYSITNLSKIRDGTYVIYFDESKSIGIHWIAMYVSSSNATYFDSFVIKYIPKETKNFIGNNNITSNIYRIQSYSIMCGYFCIGFINFMLNNQSLTDFTNLFSRNNFQK